MNRWITLNWLKSRTACQPGLDWFASTFGADARGVSEDLLRKRMQASAVDPGWSAWLSLELDKAGRELPPTPNVGDSVLVFGTPRTVRNSKMGPGETRDDLVVDVGGRGRWLGELDWTPASPAAPDWTPELVAAARNEACVPWCRWPEELKLRMLELLKLGRTAKNVERLTSSAFDDGADWAPCSPMSRDLVCGAMPHRLAPGFDPLAESRVVLPLQLDADWDLAFEHPRFGRVKLRGACAAPLHAEPACPPAGADGLRPVPNCVEVDA